MSGQIVRKKCEEIRTRTSLRVGSTRVPINLPVERIFKVLEKSIKMSVPSSFEHTSTVLVLQFEFSTRTARRYLMVDILVSVKAKSTQILINDVMLWSYLLTQLLLSGY